MNEVNERQDKRRERQKRFNEELKYWLLYVGFATAIISAIAYLIIVAIIVVGFSSAFELQSRIYFSLFTSAIGLIISFSLRSQGITFAQKEDASIEVMNEYRALLNKKKKDTKLHDIKHYMIWKTITDIITKGISITVSMVGLIYFFSKGNGDWTLFGLALSNILMFTGFGLIALSKAYDHYLDEHIPVIKQRITRLKDKIKQDEEKEHTNELQVIKVPSKIVTIDKEE